MMARGVGKENGFVIVILRSDSSSLGKKIVVSLGCERGGKFRAYKNAYKQETTRTKKIECLFRLKGRFGITINGWKLKVMCGFHNHKTAESLVGHPFLARLGKAENALVADMLKAFVG